MKKYKILLIALTFITFIKVNAQSWQWVKQGGSTSIDHVSKICTDANDNIYAIGDFGFFFPPGGNMFFDNDTAYQNGVNQLFLVKYTPSGTVAWVKSIGGNNSNSGNCNNCENSYDLCFDAFSNSIYMTGKLYGQATFGSTNLFGWGNMFLTKIDLNGNFIWAKLYGSITSQPYASISTDQVGNVFLSGYTNDSLYFDNIGIPSGTFWSKLDGNGTALWAKIISVNAGSGKLFFIGNDIYSLFSTSNDTAWVDTLCFVSSTPHNILLGKFNTAAGIESYKTFSSDSTNYLSARMGLDSSNNIYLSGTFKHDIDLGDTSFLNSNIYDFFIAKYDLGFNLIWIKNGNDPMLAQCVNISVANNGNTFLLCNTSIDGVFIAGFNSSGDSLGMVKIDMSGGTFSLGLTTIDNSENIIIAANFGSPTFTFGGTTFTNFGTDDVFIAKHDAITGIGGEGRIANNQLIIYANPNAGKCNITVPDDFIHEKNLALSIYDNTGKLIQQKTLEMNDGKIKLNLEAEAKGIYSVTLNNKKKSYNGKIIFE